MGRRRVAGRRRGYRAPYSRCWECSGPLRFSAGEVVRHSIGGSSAVAYPVPTNRPCFQWATRGGAEAAARARSTAGGGVVALLVLTLDLQMAAHELPNASVPVVAPAWPAPVRERAGRRGQHLSRMQGCSSVVVGRRRRGVAERGYRVGCEDGEGSGRMAAVQGGAACEGGGVEASTGVDSCRLVGEGEAASRTLREGSCREVSGLRGWPGAVAGGIGVW